MEMSIRCLSVEDDVVDQQRILRAADVPGVALEVEFATTLEAARKALVRNHYSVILVDNSLPDGIGVDFAEELARNPKFRDVSIILHSGWPSPFMWAKARNAGLRVIEKDEQAIPSLQAEFMHHALSGNGPADEAAVA